MSASDYKTIFASVRPQRVAVFIDLGDSDWQDTCLRIIEFYSTLWGGKYNIIVPTDGNTISDTFWKILETFDPDYLYVYSKSLLDLKLAKPEEYGKILEREIDKLQAENPHADRDDIRSGIDEQLQQAPYQDNLAISNDLQNQLKRRLAPFYLENWIVQPGGIGAHSEARFPQTSLPKILPNTDHSNEITSVDAPGVPPLWYSAVTGRIHEPYAAELKDIGVHTTVRSFKDDLWDLFYNVVKGRNERGVTSPFDLTLTGIELYRSLKYRYWEEPKLVVVGDTIDDFCLYYSLSRMRDGVCWFLPTWLSAVGTAAGTREDNHATRFAHALRNALLERNTSRKAVLMSASLNRTELERVRQRLDTASLFGHGSLQTQMDITDGLDVIDAALRFPLVAYERDNVSKDLSKQFVDGQLMGLFETPKPKTFAKIDPAEHRWISELLFHRHQLPRDPSLGTWVVRDHRLGTGEARAGRNGVAYFCPNLGYFGGDIDRILVRPSLYVPDAFEVFSRICEAAGMTCRLSDKGFYAQDSIQKFKTLEMLAEFLRHERKRSLLGKFLDRTRPGEGIHDEGVFLSSDQRRYLNFASIQKLIGSDTEAATMIDDLIRAGVLYRGFIFKCAYCRNADWFQVDEVTQEFKCKRCGRPQIYTKDHWLEPREPAWFYKLDEIVYQGYRNDMSVPLLVLDYLRRKAPDSFLYTNELQVSEKNVETTCLELDICCIPEGVLTIGEAKKENRLGTTASEEERAITTYRDTANRIGAKQVVFATMAATWPEATANKTAQAFQATNIKTILLTRNELLAAS